MHVWRFDYSLSNTSSLLFFLWSEENTLGCFFNQYNLPNFVETTHWLYHEYLWFSTTHINDVCLTRNTYKRWLDIWFFVVRFCIVKLSKICWIYCKIMFGFFYPFAICNYYVINLYNQVYWCSPINKDKSPTTCQGNYYALHRHANSI